MNFNDVSCSHRQHRSAITYPCARSDARYDDCSTVAASARISPSESHCSAISPSDPLRRTSLWAGRRRTHRMDLSRPTYDCSGCSFRLRMNACSRGLLSSRHEGPAKRDERTSLIAPTASPPSTVSALVPESLQPAKEMTSAPDSRRRSRYARRETCRPLKRPSELYEYGRSGAARGVRWAT
jgi:hypothetical protein